MAHDDFLRHAKLGQFGLFKFDDVDVGIAGQVIRHIDQGAGQIFNGFKALVEFRGIVDFLLQLHRHRLASLVMQGKPAQDLGRRQPVFIELRRELDEVGRRIGAGLRRVIAVRAERMDGVAELVEQGRRVVPRNQQGLTGFGLEEVAVVRGDAGVLQYARLRLVFGLPRPRRLAFAGIGVEVPQADLLAVAHDLVGRDIRMEDRHVVDLDESKAIHLVGAPEDGFLDLRQLQILLDLAFVEVVARLAHLLGVETIVPRLDSDALALAVGDLLHVGDLFVDALDRRAPHGLHQAHGVFRCLGHGDLQAPVRMGRIAVQLGAFGA